jgi:tetratricopeptide (TPR) repeat protein
VQYRALSAEESAARGSDHPNVALALTGMGLCETGQGRLGPAVEHLERALVIREAHEGDPADRAQTELALAEALWPGEGRARAVELGRRARDAYAAMGTAKLAELAAAEAWLAAHRAPSG